MTMSDAVQTSISALVPIAVICFFVWLNFGDQIKFMFNRERIEMKNIESHSYEVQRTALYHQKLVKVYNLVVELNVDEGFYFELKKKIKGEIEYVERQLQIELGKELLESMKEKNTEDSA